MTGVELALLALVLVVGFYTAWNIGANDVANAMGTSVGSGALTLKQAVILAGIFEFLGAYLVGSNVSETVRKKMFDPELFSVFYGEQAALVLGCGMIAALMAAGTWLLIASYFGLPVSTTHSIVGAVVGIGCVGVGVANVEWSKVTIITAGWVLSPVMSGTVSYFLFRWILRRVFYKKKPVEAAKQLAPYLTFAVLIVLIGVTTYKGMKPLWGRLGVDPFEPRVMVMTACIAVVLSLFGMLITRRLVRNIVSDESEGPNPVLQADASRSLGKAIMHLRRVRDSVDEPMNDRIVQLLGEAENVHDAVRKHTEYGTDSPSLQQVERIFVYLQILTACFVAFAHGSNDVANAIGPMSAAYQAISTGEVALTAGTPGWALALGGIGIIVGLATWGWRVIGTVGTQITELTPSRGFCAEFSAAITILLASLIPFGLPISTTHTLVGSILGVGLARGLSSINLTVARNIFASWIVTIPSGAGMAIVFYYLLRFIFLEQL